jgi:hypothetical protein
VVTYRGLRLLIEKDRHRSFVDLRARCYLNKIVKQDHRAIEQRCK